jgi:hypothetical protein
MHTHKSTPSQNQHGFFKSNIFGTTRRPSTSGGAQKEGDPTAVGVAVTGTTDPTHGLNRKASFRGRFTSISDASPERRRPSIQKDSSEITREQSKPNGQQTPAGTASHSRGHSRRDSYTAILPFSNMLVRPGTSHSSFGGAPLIPPNQLPSPTLENITYLHIQETSSKRISTLDYLRKAYVCSLLSRSGVLIGKGEIEADH